MLDTREARSAFFRVFGGVRGWREMRDALTREKKTPRPSATKAAAVRRRMAHLDALALKWQHETRDLAGVAGDVASRIDADCARLPDRLRLRYVETWLRATREQGDLRLVRAVVSRMAGSVLGFDMADNVRLSGRARRAAFEVYASMLGEADGLAYRGRGTAVATGHRTMGAVVYTEVREMRPRDTAPHSTPRPKCGTVAQAREHRERLTADLEHLRRFTAARRETTQGLCAPVVCVPSPEVTPSTGDGADATRLG